MMTGLATISHIYLPARMRSLRDNVRPARFRWPATGSKQRSCYVTDERSRGRSQTRAVGACSNELGVDCRANHCLWGGESRVGLVSHSPMK